MRIVGRAGVFRSARRAALLLGFLLAVSLQPSAAQITRASVGTDGHEADAPVGAPALSGDGRFVAFHSDAELVPEAHETCRTAGRTCSQIYLRDLWTDTLTLVSLNDAGDPADGFSRKPSLSADGRFVAFLSDATNLDEQGATPSAGAFGLGLFVRDRLSGRTTRVGVTSAGLPLDAAVRHAVISGDGRFVAFASRTAAVVPNPILAELLLLHDRELATTVAIGFITVSPYTLDIGFDISGDGRYVAYCDYGASASGQRLEVYDRLSNTSTSANAPGSGCAAVSINATGRFVALQRSVPGASWTTASILDRNSGELVDIALTAGSLANVPARISADGRWVAFAGVQFPMVSGRPDGPHVFLYDRLTHHTMRANLDATGKAVAEGAAWPALSADGRTLAFTSLSPDLVPHDTNGLDDVFVMALDPDEDGMPTPWELAFALDPNDRNDAAGDPDGDGRTSADEYAAGTHPRAVARRHLAEGSTGGFFTTRIAVFNPDAGRARALARFMTDDGRVAVRLLQIDGLHREVLYPASELAPSTGVSFSTVVEADRELVVERVMSWDGDSHAETAMNEPSTTWYLAEGATHSGFELFYLIENPGDEAARVSVEYLLPSPAIPVSRSYGVAAHSRLTIWVDQESPSLANTDVAAAITADRPITVERAMYLADRAGRISAGHVGGAVPIPSLEWHLAEGATGPFFDHFVLVANPGDGVSRLDVTYRLPDAASFVKAYEVAPRSRLNIWVNHEDPRLAATAVAVSVRVVNGMPVVVDRAMWWPAGGWTSAHAGHAVPQAGTHWVIADGQCQRGLADTYLLVANTSSHDGRVRVTVFDDFGNQHEQEMAIEAERRMTLPLCQRFGLDDAGFSMIVDSLDPESAAIAVETSTYTSVAGRFWSAGTNVAATPRD